MAPNPKRLGIRAADDRWQLLGEQLETRRRVELGYQYRPAFAKERGINIRRVQDIENSYRPNTYPAGSLREIARAYDVSYESVLAVLRGGADALVPARGPELPPAPAGGLPDREDSVRLWAVPIWDRLLALALKGVSDPDGALLFGAGTADAKAWDGTAGRGMSLPDRAWLVADLQRRAAARGRGRSETG